MAELRPLELGELVDRAFTLWRAHWRKLFPLAFAFNLVTYAASKAMVLLEQKYFPALYNGSEGMNEAMRNDPSGMWGQLIGMMSVVMVFFAVVLLISSVSGVAVTRWLHPIVVGNEQPSLTEAARHALQRLGRTTLAWLLAMAWTAGVSLLLMVPGGLIAAVGGLLSAGDRGGKVVGVGLLLIGTGLMMLGMVVGLLWSVVRFALVSQVLSLEDKGAWETIRRCGQLSSGSIAPGFMGRVKVRLALLITLLTVLLLLITQLASAPVWVLRSIYGGPLDFQNLKMHLIPAYALVPAELLQYSVTSIVGPIYVAFQLLFYIDLRVRREGLDLEQKLAAVAPEAKAAS